MPYKDKQKKLNHGRQYYKKNIKIISKKNRQRRLKNPNYQKEWYKKHPDYYPEYYKKNRIKQIASIRKYQERNKTEIREKRKIYVKKRRSTLKWKLDNRMASSISRSLKGNKKGRKWESLVGYTVKDLKKHLQKQFKNSMNWQKFIKGKIHIDHIIPKINFKYTLPEDREFKKCWSLKNLQPLYASDNIKKGFLEG